MSASAQYENRAGRERRDHWFRQLDQLRVIEGGREWAVQVTAILDEEDVLWVQIADDSPRAGSVLLRMCSAASVEQAIAALNSRTQRPVSYPAVINTCLSRGLS